MGDWNTSGEPVSVGAWVANNLIKTEDGATMETMDEIGDVAWYSSYGTDRAGHQHPDICAPGNYVAAALNSFDSQYSDYNVYLRKGYTDQFVGQTSSRDYSWGWMSGTSMSTPAAAGVVALWMQAAADLGKTLNCSDIKDIIIHSCDTDEFTARSPERFGLEKSMLIRDCSMCLVLRPPSRDSAKTNLRMLLSAWLMICFMPTVRRMVRQWHSIIFLACLSDRPYCRVAPSVLQDCRKVYMPCSWANWDLR